ncbi:MAG: HAD-IA family hydrolase [Gammaproteobacteria bacterium]|nr:HAD-IA family hydrolase [Gammaproteobacteria bacterium]
MKYKLLVFDWDGTLMDSQQEIISCFQLAAKDMQIALPAVETVRNVIGLGMREAVLGVFPEVTTEDEISTFIDHYRHHYFSPDKPPSLLYDGVFDMLQSLMAQDYFLSVATGKGRNGLNAALKRTTLDKVFHYTRCVDEAPSKPHPQMLEDSMDYFGVEPHETLMIGDTEYDLQMATNAGVDSVGVHCGAHEPERLQKHNPQICFENTNELEAWLSGL